MKFLQAFHTALGLAEIAEQAIPLSGKGKEKLDFVVGGAAAIFDTEEEIRSSWKDPQAFGAAVAKAATLIVTLKNAAGAFKK